MIISISHVTPLGTIAHRLLIREWRFVDMRFTVDTVRLRPALNALLSSTGHRDTLPILTGILVQTDGADTVWTAYNQISGVEVTVPATVEQPGAAVLPGRPIGDLVRRLDRDELRIDTENGQTTTLEWTGAQATIPLFNPDDFPRPSFAVSARQTVPGDEFRRGVDHVAYAAAKDAARGSALEGIELQFRPDGLDCLATDQIRLAWSRRTGNGGAVGERVVVPVSALQTLVRLAPQEDEYQFAWDEKGITFFWPETRLHSRLLSGSLPDVTRLVPESYPSWAVVSRSALIGACDRVASLAGTPGVQVRMAWQADKVQLFAEDVGHRAEETLPCRLVGQPITIAFNSHLFKENLEHLEGDEVVVEMVDADRAARLRPVDGRDQFSLISPMIQPR